MPVDVRDILRASDSCPNLSKIGIHIPGLGGSQSCRDCSSTVGRHLAVRVRGEWLCSETAGGTSQPLAAADPTLDLGVVGSSAVLLKLYTQISHGAVQCDV